jgi:hypothetical protein
MCIHTHTTKELNRKIGQQALTTAGLGGLLGGGLGGLLGGGSGGAAGSSAKYVQLSLHDNLDCSSPVSIRATYGANICLVLDSATNGAQSLMYQFTNLALNQVLFSDTSCQHVLASQPVGALASLQGTCLLGVEVSVSSTYVAPTGNGELISEYVSLAGCNNNQPLQTAWISASHLSNLVGLNLAPLGLGSIGLGIDDTVQQLSSELGNSRVCVDTNIQTSANLGSVLPVLVDIDVGVYVSVTRTH